MRKLILLILFFGTVMIAWAQRPDFPFNYAIPNSTAESLLKKLPKPDSPFEGYKPEERQMLATEPTRLWKGLKIGHFEDKESLAALFLFNEHNKLKTIRFSSSNLAEIRYDNRPTGDEDYFVMYGKPLITYFKKAGWKVQGNPIVFPISLIKKNQTLAVRIDTLYDVALSPEEDSFSGFHYHYPSDHIASQNKYLRFELNLK